MPFNRYVRLCFLSIAALLVFFSAPEVNAQQTVGLFVNDGRAFEGYTLFAPFRDSSTYLVDMYGRFVHSWPSAYTPGNSVYLLENGNIMRAGRPEPGGGGIVQEIDWDGNVVWEYTYYDSIVRQHHDFEVLPNGNVLLLAWEIKTREEAIAAGRDSTLLADDELWPEHVVEVQPVGSDSGVIVWEWHLWDHLVQDHDSTKDNYGVVSQHPELVNINWMIDPRDDWIHANAVDYNPEFDQIILSTRSLSELWVIDHSTTTAEAAGHTGGRHGMGGDIVYRWGNPQVYNAGVPADQQSILQHDCQWIEPGLPGEGNIIFFNNGGPDRAWSTITEITPQVNDSGIYPQPLQATPHGPAEPTWEYEADPPTDFYSRVISGCQRLPNGNTLICEGVGARLFEMNTDGEIVWQYVSPINSGGPIAQGSPVQDNLVFRSYRYAPDFPGLAGRDLTPTGRIELYPVEYAGTNHFPEEPTDTDSVIVTAVVSADSGLAGVDVWYHAGGGFLSVAMYDDGMHHDELAGDGLYGAVLPPQPALTTVEYYLRGTDSTGAIANDPPNPPVTVYGYQVDGLFVCGDVDGSQGSPNIADLTFLVAYLFNGGPAPLVYSAADMNGGDGSINILDLTYLVTYLFSGGPAPVCVE